MIDVSTTSERLARITFNNPIPPSDPAPTLSTLPVDLIIQIYTHLDLSSALSLLKVAKAFVSPAESTIWRDMDFATPFIHAHYMTYCEEGPLETEEDEIREENRRVAAAEGHNFKLRRKYLAMMDEANTRRWKMIKKIRAATHPVIDDLPVHLLEQVSSTLESLHLEYMGRTLHPDAFDKCLLRLDSRMQLCGDRLSFSSLTSLQLDRGTFPDISFIHFLCEACPNLISLNLTFTNEESTEIDPAVPTLPPPKYLTKPTMIRYLCIAYDYIEDGSQVADEKAIGQLLGFCPMLHRLSLPAEDPSHGFHARTFLPYLI